MKTIEEIRKAFLAMHHYATKENAPTYMSIPPDPERDADLILSDAIDELEKLRAASAVPPSELQVENDGLRERVRVLQEQFIEATTDAAEAHQEAEGCRILAAGLEEQVAGLTTERNKALAHALELERAKADLEERVERAEIFTMGLQAEVRELRTQRDTARNGQAGSGKADA